MNADGRHEPLPPHARPPPHNAPRAPPAPNQSRSPLHPGRQSKPAPRSLANQSRRGTLGSAVIGEAANEKNCEWDIITHGNGAESVRQARAAWRQAAAEGSSSGGALGLRGLGVASPQKTQPLRKEGLKWRKANEAISCMCRGVCVLCQWLLSWFNCRQ